jgi:hypothetical protein
VAKAHGRAVRNDTTITIRVPADVLARAHAKAAELHLTLADMTRMLIELACDCRHAAGERIGSYAEVSGIVIVNRHPSL